MRIGGKKRGQKGIKRNKKEQKGKNPFRFGKEKAGRPDAEGNGCTGETEKIEKKVEFFRKM